MGETSLAISGGAGSEASGNNDTHIFAPTFISRPVDLTQGVATRFRGPEDLAMETDDALVKTTLVLLHERWPKTVGFDDLLRDVSRRMEFG